MVDIGQAPAQMLPRNPTQMLLYSVGGIPTDDLSHAITDMHRAAATYQKADAYYRGEVPEVFASVRLRRALKRNGMNFQLNFAKTPVDAVSDRLEISSITAGDDEDLTQALEDMWEYNCMELEAPNVQHKALKFGDYYVFIWPNQDDPTKVDIFPQDPRTVRAFYDPQNPRVTLFTAKRWQISPPSAEALQFRVDLYYPNRIEQWISRPGSDGTKEDDYVPLTNQVDSEGNATHLIVNPFNVIPIVHFRTGADEYGTPEHKGFWSVTDAIHKLVMAHLAGVDYQSFPQRWALMTEDGDSSEPAALDEGLFSIDMQDQGITYDMGAEAASQFRSDPGSLWYMQGVKQVGQFETSDPTVFMTPIEFYLKAGAQITSTPLHYFDVAGDTPSGESLRAAEAPFIKKVRTRQLAFGAAWKKVFQIALLMCGHPNVSTDVRWMPAATTDDVTTWEVALAKQKAGVPVTQTILEGGYTADQVAAWRNDGQADLPQKLGLVNQLGLALVGVAQAVKVNAITPEQINPFLVTIMNAIQDDPTALIQSGHYDVDDDGDDDLHPVITNPNNDDDSGGPA